MRNAENCASSQISRAILWFFDQSCQPHPSQMPDCNRHPRRAFPNPAPTSARDAGAHAALPSGPWRHAAAPGRRRRDRARRPARGHGDRVASGSCNARVTLHDDIPAGHKFAVRALAAGLRIRKYGEYIGRTTAAVAAGRVGPRAQPRDQRAARRAHERAGMARSRRGRRGPARARRRALHRRRESAVSTRERDRLYWIDVRETPGDPPARSCDRRGDAAGRCPRTSARSRWLRR